MRTRSSLFFTIAAIGLMVNSANSQSISQPEGKQHSRIITAYAGSREVRFVSVGELIQIRVEIIDPPGQEVFDSGYKAGNTLDWPVTDPSGNHLVDNSYLCVVTVKDAAGLLSRKHAVLVIDQEKLTLQRTDKAKLAGAQAQRLDINQSQPAGSEQIADDLTILREENSASTAVLAHDGGKAHLVSSSGGLSISSGDFFANKAVEHLRLTAEGNLGIGVSNPQAKLDVAGAIRTSEGIIFPDGTIQTTAADLISGKRKTGAEQGAKSTDQSKRSGKGGKGERTVSPEFNVNEDLIVNGNIIFTPQIARDINMQNNNGGLRFYGAPTLTATPDAAAIQFWGNNSGFPGQAFIDSGANDNAAVIFRTAVTGGTVIERMRVTSTGNVGIGTNNPGVRLDVAGVINTTTQYNIGGNRVMSTPGVGNMFVGIAAGASNTTGTDNSFFGRLAGGNNSTGSSNSFFGSRAGEFNQGTENSFFGTRAGFSNISGTANSFFGSDSSSSNETGSFNSSFGQSAGLHNNGNENSFFGASAGQNNSTGKHNVFVGAGAGFSNTTEDNNTFIGDHSNGAIGITNATVIGANALVTQSNSLVLGGINTINGASADTSVGIGTTAPKTKLHMEGGDILLGAGQGIILKSPDGTKCAKVTIDNAGALTTNSVSCP